MATAPQKVWVENTGWEKMPFSVNWYPGNETWRGVRREFFSSLTNARAWWEHHGCELINPVRGA